MKIYTHLAGTRQINQRRMQSHKRRRVAGERVVLFDASAADVVNDVAHFRSRPDDRVYSLSVHGYRQYLAGRFGYLYAPGRPLEAVGDASGRCRLYNLAFKKKNKCGCQTGTVKDKMVVAHIKLIIIVK